ncbi:unnamed protein product, partial [Ectocarpus sp. 13 AM-2016]
WVRRHETTIISRENHRNPNWRCQAEDGTRTCFARKKLETSRILCILNVCENGTTYAHTYTPTSSSCSVSFRPSQAGRNSISGVKRAILSGHVGVHPLIYAERTSRGYAAESSYDYQQLTM